MIYMMLCLAVLVAGLCRGKAWPATHSLGAYTGTLLFWVAVTGIVAILVALAAIVGIAATFDESTDSWNRYDDLCLIGRQIAWVCSGIALLLHGTLVVAERSKNDKGRPTPTRDGVPAAHEE